MSLQVKNLIIGEGIPKICVPITGVSKKEILTQASCYQGYKFAYESAGIGYRDRRLHQ